MCHVWCAIVALRDFERGNTCFPQLGVKIDYSLGLVVFMCSYTIIYQSVSYIRNKNGVIYLTHQIIYNLYIEITGKPLKKFGRSQIGDRESMRNWRYTHSYFFNQFFHFYYHEYYYD